MLLLFLYLTQNVLMRIVASCVVKEVARVMRVTKVAAQTVGGATNALICVPIEVTTVFTANKTNLYHINGSN